MERTNKEILVVTSAPVKPYTEGAKSLFDGVPRLARLDPNIVKQNLEEFFDSAKDMILGIPKAIEPYRVEEIEISLEITAEGSIQLIGGLKAGATGGLTVKLKHQ